MKSLVLVLLIQFAYANFSFAQSENTLIDVTIRTQTVSQQSLVQLEVDNNGKFPLNNIQAYIQKQQSQAFFKTPQNLMPGEQLSADLSIDIPGRLLGGNFFLPVIVSYKDINNINISTISLAKFVSDPTARQPFELTLEEPQLGNGCRDTHVSVENLHDTGMTVNLELLTSAAIRVEPHYQSATLTAKQSTDLYFKLCRVDEIGDGQYPLHVIASTVHHGPVVQVALSTNIKIESLSLPSRFFQNQLLIGGLILLAFMILCLVWLQAIFKSA